MSRHTDFKPQVKIHSKRIQVAKAKTVIDIRRLNPYATLQQIGDRVGVTRERIRQILSKADKPTAHIPQTYRPSHFSVLCRQCGAELKGRNRHFCNYKCKHTYNYIKIPCNYCGKMTEVLASQFINRIKHGLADPNKKFYCDRTCLGLWLGHNHGFGAHPENSGRRK